MDRNASHFYFISLEFKESVRKRFSPKQCPKNLCTCVSRDNKCIQIFDQKYSIFIYSKTPKYLPKVKKKPAKLNPKSKKKTTAFEQSNFCPILTKRRHFHEFFSKKSFDKFSREIKVLNSKKSKTTAFSRVFHQKQFDNFSREIKVEFLYKK